MTRVHAQPVRRLAASTLLAIAVAAHPATSAAHNEKVHQEIAQTAYDMIRYSASHRPVPGSATTYSASRVTTVAAALRAAPPSGVPAAEWVAFLDGLERASQRLGGLRSGLDRVENPRCVPLDGQDFRTLPDRWPHVCPQVDRDSECTLRLIDRPLAHDYNEAANCGILGSWSAGGILAELPVDYTGQTLGYHAARIDFQHDDTHLFTVVTNAGDGGKTHQMIDEAADLGMAVILAPIACLVALFTGDNCWDLATDLADRVVPIDDLNGLVPGFGDTTSPVYTGMWHFINLNPRATNRYDDHEGLFYENAGWGGVPDAVDFGIVVALALGGRTVHYDAAKGPQRYQVQGARDGQRDSTWRGKKDWQSASAAFVPFTPVDNLAYYGWRQFVDEAARSRQVGRAASAAGLAWPLHAVGDAASPMHTIGSSGWGHRPFEDAVDVRWPDILLWPKEGQNTSATQLAMLRRVLGKAYQYHQQVLVWRRADPARRARDLPVRDLVTTIAKETYEYAAAKMASHSWPYKGFAPSLGYPINAAWATSFYTDLPEMADLTRPLIENALAGSIVLYLGAAEVMP
jgi:hypothetical protein